MECTVVRSEMMDVLYGEADAETIRRVEEHQNVCRACSEEMASLRRLRRDLGQWKLPEGGRPRFRRPRGWSVPLWASAAAVLLGLTAGFGLSGSELRYSNGQFSFRLGRGESTAELRRLVMEQAKRTDEEMRAIRAALRSADGGEAVLKRAEALVQASEVRQLTLLTTSLTEFQDQLEQQRLVDLALTNAGFRYMEGKAGEQAARTNALMGQMFQVAQKR